MFQIVRVPSFGWLEYCEAEYYGYRHSLHIGHYIVMFGVPK